MWFQQGCWYPAASCFFTLAEAQDRSSPETFSSTLNLTQVPCHTARTDVACRHKSKYFRSRSSPTLFTHPHRHLKPPFPHQFQHSKPAICHKVIIELSIGEQLTVPPSTLSPSQSFNLQSDWQVEKSFRVTHLIPLGFRYSLQINRGTGTKRPFYPLFPALIWLVSGQQRGLWPCPSVSWIPPTDTHCFGIVLRCCLCFYLLFQ